MRGIPSPVLDLLDQNLVTFHGAHVIGTTPEQRVWSGAWELDALGDGDMFMPLGATNLVTPVTYEIGQVANGFQIVLSSLDTRLAPLSLTTDLRGQTLSYYTLFFDRPGMNLLHAELDLFGSVDEVQWSRTKGGVGTVVFRLEAEAQGAKRTGGRICSDADQRLVDPNDNSFKFKSTAPDQILYWYGSKSGPRRAAAAVRE